MRKAIACIVLAMLLPLAGASRAATYWVSPTGSSGASGADSSANAKTLAWFNANAVAGDVCRFKSGTYSSPIQPAGKGTSGNRIRYYGFPQDPGAVRVTNIKFGGGSNNQGSYCTAKWFTTTSGFSAVDGIESPTFYPVGDSIVNVRVAVDRKSVV